MCKVVVSSIVVTILFLVGSVSGFQNVGGGTPARQTQLLAVVDRNENDIEPSSRRNFLSSIAAAAALSTVVTAPSPANARFVLDDDTGEYVELEDEDWQTAWRQRLDKANSMSKDEIFQAARGAGNTNLKADAGVEESAASKKRRAMSACRDAGVRNKANAGNEKDCTARVFAGEVDFLLEAL